MKQRNGFTLIELLIVMAITSVLMVGIVSLFKSNRESFDLMNQVREMEENGRIAVDFLARDIRPSGASGIMVMPLIPYDNAGGPNTIDPGSIVGQEIKPGTDAIEMFINRLAEPVCIPECGTVTPKINCFNSNNANSQIPPNSLFGLPDYNLGMNGTALGELLDNYAMMAVDRSTGGATASCEQNITGGGWTAGKGRAQLQWNRGRNVEDEANRPRDCAGLAGSSNVCLAIGNDNYYYIRDGSVSGAVDQLVRYSVGDGGGAGSIEVIANNIEDLQIEYGIDVDGDDIVEAWVNGDTLTNSFNVHLVRVSVLLKTEEIDPKKAAAAPTQLANSTIPNIGTNDNFRRRIMTRTIRLRNN